MWDLLDIVDIPWDRQEEWTSESCRRAAKDRDVLAGLHAEFEFRNQARRVAARILGQKSDGFPTISLKAMFAKAWVKKVTKRKIKTS